MKPHSSPGRISPADSPNVDSTDDAGNHWRIDHDLHLTQIDGDRGAAGAVALERRPS
jgi:hypothetical protein